MVAAICCKPCCKPSANPEANQKVAEIIDCSTPPARANGWIGPYPWQQRVAIAICLGDPILYGGLLVPLLQENLQLAFSVVYVACFLAMVITGVWTMTVDPIDEVTLKVEPSDVEKASVKLWCKHCERNVHQGSKHCWDCGKCTLHFDHHCPWLNTCIGGKNYRPFFVASSSLLVMISLGIVVAALILFGFVRDDTILALYRVAVVAALAFHVPLLMLITSLVGFHTWLCVTRMTTYDYVKTRRARREKRQELEAMKLKQQKVKEPLALDQVAGRRCFGLDLREIAQGPLGCLKSASRSVAEAQIPNVKV